MKKKEIEGIVYKEIKREKKTVEEELDKIYREGSHEEDTVVLMRLVYRIAEIIDERDKAE